MQDACKCGMVSDEVLELLNHMKKEKVLSIHPYTITAPKSSSGRWQTYIKDDSDKRQKVSSTTEKGLYLKLYEHYFSATTHTISSLYPEWLERRRETGVSPRTVRRNEDHWNKYYAHHKIVSVPLAKLTVEQMEQFFHETIRKYSLTVKELANMKFLLADMLKLAKKKKIIAYNPFQDVEINLNACRPPKRHNDTSRIYLPDEKEKLFLALNDEISANPDVSDMYAIFLLFKLGLRIGELVALKWEDIDVDSMEIHIHRMETYETDADGNLKSTVVNYTKKKSVYGDRFLPLSAYELDIFQIVKELNETYQYQDKGFIFCDGKGRTKIREIDNRIRKLCNKAGIQEKSAHDIRRTVASEMFANGVSMEIIKNFLGHSDIKTTFGYILDIQSKEDTQRQILTSLSNLNGLKRTQIV